MTVSTIPTSTLNVPYLGTGRKQFRYLKNCYAADLAKLHGLKTPLIFKEVRRPIQCDSWHEYRYELLRQLQPLSATEIKLCLPDVEDYGSWLPLYPVGQSRSAVAFVHERLYPLVIGLAARAEDVIAYLKAAVSSEYAYQLHQISGLNIQIKEDEVDGVLTDGLGYCHPDLLQELGARKIIQFRMFHAGLKHAGLAKGLLKGDADLPPNTIRLSKSQLKGKVHDLNWRGSDKEMIIGILRRYDGSPSVAQESYTFSEFWHEIRDAEIPLALAAAKELIEILKDPVKLCEYRGVFVRDHDDLSTVESLMKIAAGSTSKDPRLPDLFKHPFVQKTVIGACASKLRHLATSGAREWPYPVVTEILTSPEMGRAIKTSLFPIGTELAVARYPLLEGRNIGYGTVIERSLSPTEVILGSKIAGITNSDSDGDAVMLMDDPVRVALAKRIEEERTKTISKNLEKLNSSLFELNDVIAKNLFTASVGMATLAMVAAEIQKDVSGRHACAETVQDCTDAMKKSVNTSAGRKLAKELLDRYGLPDHIVFRNDPLQFSDPAKTLEFDSSPLWKAIAGAYIIEGKSMKNSSLSLRSFANILGSWSFKLDRCQMKELAAVVNLAYKELRDIYQIEKDEKLRLEKVKAVFDRLRIWKGSLNGEPKHWAAAFWTLCHSSNHPGATAAMIFRIFPDEILGLLSEIYRAQELIPVRRGYLGNEAADLQERDGMILKGCRQNYLLDTSSFGQKNKVNGMERIMN